MKTVDQGPQMPAGPQGLKCPLWKKPMSEVCQTCPMWVMVRGTNPNTGEPVDRWECAFALMPVLMIENSQQQRATGAAIESFRNETIKAQIATNGIAMLEGFRGNGR